MGNPAAAYPPKLTQEFLDVQTVTWLKVKLMERDAEIKKETKQISVETMDMSFALDAAQSLLEIYEGRLALGAAIRLTSVQFNFFEDVSIHRHDKIIRQDVQGPIHHIIFQDALVETYNKRQDDYMREIGAAGMVKTNIGLATLPQNIFGGLSRGGVQPYFTHAEYDPQKESLIYLLRDKKIITLGSTRAPLPSAISKSVLELSGV